MGELEFQQRWEFRRNEDNDIDSSCDDSKSSSGPLLKKHKLVSSLISSGDDETSRLKRKSNENPGRGNLMNIGKGKKQKTRNISSKLRNSKMKKDSPEEVDLEKGETRSAYDPDPLDDLKNFMDSLLQDLKVTRENLFKWMIEEMQKLVADGTTPEPKRRKSGHKGEKVQLQQIKKSKEVQDQHEKTHNESMQFQHPNNSEKSIQVQHQTNFQETVLAQHHSNFQENVKLQVQLEEEENIDRQHQNNFRYGMRTQNCNNRSSVRFPKCINAADSTDYFNALGNRVDSGQGTELITSSKSVKPNLQTSCDDQNVQVQSHKSFVLAREIPESNAGSLKRSVKLNTTVYLSDIYQVPEDQGGHGQAMRTVESGTNREKLGSSVVQNFLSSSSVQAPSSMYLTLPTVLTEPIVANHGLDASMCNNILPRVAEKRRGFNSERVNQMLEPSSFQGSFPVIPPEERIRSFALMGFRNMGCNQSNTPTAGIETGFPVPLHQGIDGGLSIPRQVNQQYLSQETSKPLGLRMNGGAIMFSGGSYNLPEHTAANNHHSHPAYKRDGRLISDPKH
ncbi:uncharacterized protein LOC111302441 [Durio zibethinus]|uniref:Uncharacterized protein LOC111302441 n=1 Tax=Durio zibethinus TaxID=66656 RepID=A0A6P5ZP09_DURZI|nr:uncharacterized protein LOC111302441 [Durio zibethinus]